MSIHSFPRILYKRVNYLFLFLYTGTHPPEVPGKSVYNEDEDNNIKVTRVGQKVGVKRTEYTTT